GAVHPHRARPCGVAHAAQRPCRKPAGDGEPSSSRPADWWDDGIEVGVFLAAGILIGLLGTAALGEQQLGLNSPGLNFIVPLDLSQAATVRVAFELGAGRAAAARRAGFVALALGIGFMSATAVVLWTVPEAVIAVYVDIADPANHQTVEIARQLIAIAALFQ